MAIHRFRDFNDVSKTLTRKVMTAPNELDAQRELLEVLLLRREHWVCSEERNDRLDQVLPPSNHVAIQVLTVVVVSPISDHLTYPEEALEQLEARDALRALGYRELMRHLVAGPVADPASAARLADEAD